MFRNILVKTLIGTATVIAGPALAGPGGGHGAMGAPGMRLGGMAGPGPIGMSARVNDQALVRAAPRATVRSNTRSALRMSSATRARARARLGLARAGRAGSIGGRSQGLMHASLTAIERASPRSALARSAVRPSTLPGLNAGLTVKGSGGATIGTVSRVVTGTDGKIRLVIASSQTGRTIRLAPNTLSISGGVVTTTMM
jgi:hypothetical protein